MIDRVLLIIALLLMFVLLALRVWKHLKPNKGFWDISRPLQPKAINKGQMEKRVEELEAQNRRLKGEIVVLQIKPVPKPVLPAVQPNKELIELQKRYQQVCQENEQLKYKLEVSTIEGSPEAETINKYLAERDMKIAQLSGVVTQKEQENGRLLQRFEQEQKSVDQELQSSNSAYAEKEQTLKNKYDRELERQTRLIQERDQKIAAHDATLRAQEAKLWEEFARQRSVLDGQISFLKGSLEQKKNELVQLREEHAQRLKERDKAWEQECQKRLASSQQKIEELKATLSSEKQCHTQEMRNVMAEHSEKMRKVEERCVAEEMALKKSHSSEIEKQKERYEQESSLVKLEHQRVITKMNQDFFETNEQNALRGARLKVLDDSLPAKQLEDVYSRMRQRFTFDRDSAWDVQSVFSSLAALISASNLSVSDDKKSRIIRDSFMQFDEVLYARFSQEPEVLAELRNAFNDELTKYVKGYSFEWPKIGSAIDFTLHTPKKENGKSTILEVETAIIRSNGYLVQKAIVHT